MNLDLELCDAVQAGVLEQCVDLLRRGAKSDGCNLDSDTGLILAVRFKHYAIRDLLIASGADVDYCVHGRLNPLMVAAAAGDVDSCKALLAAGANVNMGCDTYEAALSYAAAEGHVAVCELLLSSGADIDNCDMYGATALSDAIVWGRQEVVDLLLTRGASVGEGEVVAAAESGHNAMLQQLLAKCGPEGKVLLDSVLSAAVSAGHGDLCRALVAQGVCPDVGHLEDAARNGRTGVCELLIELGLDPDGGGPGRKAPLHAACEGGHVDVVRLLLANGADVNIESDRKGWTPLYEAIRRHGRQDSELCRLLVRNGADTKPLCLKPNDMTPFQFAVFSGAVAAVRCLADECNEHVEQLTVEGESMSQLAGVWTEVVEVLRSVAAERAVSAALEYPELVDIAPRRSPSMSPI